MIAKGTPVEARVYPEITRQQLRDYAKASTDQNPIHLDDEAARSNGLSGVIVHGMLIAALVGNRAQEFQSESFKDLGGAAAWFISRFQIRFKAMTVPGESIRVGGQVKLVSEKEVVLDLKATNESGEIKTMGSVAFARMGA